MDVDSKKQSKFKQMITDPQTLMFEIRKHKKDVIFWSAIVVITIIIFIFISSKDYSFTLVLSALVQSFAFIIILIKVINYQNCSGLSVNTLICYAILLASRLSSTLFFTGYLPSDDSGDWFYQLTEVVSLIICCVLVYLIKYKYKETSDIMADNLQFYLLAIPTLLMSILLHTTLNDFWLTDILWTFSMYLEGIAIFPQLKLFITKRCQIENYTSHYVALCGLSRLFSLLFWKDTYKELNEVSSEKRFGWINKYSGYAVILSQVGQLVLMGDYYFYYFKSLLKGETFSTYDL